MRKINIVLYVFFPTLLMFWNQLLSNSSASAETLVQLPRRDNYGDELPQHAVARLGTVRFRQVFGNITALFMLPDSKRILTRTNTGKICIWDASDGTEIESFSDTGGPAFSNTCSLSKDGRYLAMASGGGRASVQVRNLLKREFITLPHLPKQQWSSAAISPDGKLLGVGSRGHLIVINNKKSEVLWENDRVLGVIALAFSPDGKLLISADPNLDRHSKTLVRIWDARSGEEIGKLEGHIGPIMTVLFTPGGERIASLAFDNTLRLWDVSSRRELHRVTVPKCDHIAFSPDGKLIASCGGDDRIRIWDADTLRLHREIDAPVGILRCIAFSLDGKSVIAGGNSSALHFWDIAKAQEIIPFVGHHAAVNTVLFSPNGKLLASWGSDQTVRLWDLSSNRQRWVMRIGEGYILWYDRVLYHSVHRLAFSPDSRTIAAVAGTDECKGVTKIHLIETNSGMPRLLFEEKDVPITYNTPLIAILGYSSEGAVLASYTRKSLSFWSTDSGRLLRSIPRIEGTSFALSPDGQTLITASDRIRFYSLNTGLPFRVIEDGSDNLAINISCDVTMFAYHASTRNKATRNRDSTVVIRESTTGDIIRSIHALSFRPHSGFQIGITSLAFSPYAPLLAAGTDLDNSVYVWDLISGRQIARWRGHNGPVLSVAFSPDGKLLASASADSTILLWDVSKLQPESPLSLARNELPNELPRLWEEMRAKEAAKAYQAIWRLIGASDDAVDFLSRKLHPVPAPDAKLVQQWIADLDMDDFGKRQAASEQLTKLHELAEPALRQALQGKPSLEARKRLESLLADIAGRSIAATELRQIRALHALELIGSPVARKVLKNLASGAPGARLTRDAKLALQRLERRPVKP